MNVVSPDIDRLGLAPACAVVVGGIVGVSIFFVPGAIADAAGTPLRSMAIWIIAGLISATAALSLAELSSAIPASGGTFVHLKRAYGSDFIAFAFAWMMCFAYGPAAVAVVAIMAASYLAPFLGDGFLTTVAGQKALAALLICAVAAVNVWGVRQSGAAQSGFTILKLAILAVVIGAAFLTLHPDWNVLRGDEATSPPSPVAIANSFVLSLFAYNGAIFVVQIAGEIRSPQRNVPRAILIGFGLVFALYLLVNLAYLLFLPFQSLRQSPHVAADLMDAVFGASGATVISLAIVASAAGVLNAQLLSYPRVAVMLAQGQLFPPAVGRLNERTGTPWAAIGLIAVGAILYVISGSYADILGAVAFVMHLFIVLAVGAVFVLRRREPTLPRPYRIWGYPFTPALFIVVSAVYLAGLIVTKTGQVATGLAIVALSGPVYLWRRRPQPAASFPS